jgi:predicted Rossmann-fold nucleotide-binding protein
VRAIRGRVVHVESLAEFDRRLAAGATTLTGWRVHEVNLTGRTADLERCRVAGAAFLGCTFADGVAAEVAAAGGLLLPAAPGTPVDVRRTSLYSPAELYDDPVYPRSLDARAYAWDQRPADPDATLARALHDHAIDGALAAWTAGRSLVGVMGGHAARRGDEAYAEAARLGQLLAASGHAVATGGGPGAMEAANLGAWLVRRPAAELAEAVTMLAEVPSFEPSVQDWVGVGWAVRDRFPDGGESLGIPTWHYGHEPPNVFATAIAKFFHNANREAILLQVCGAGIVFLPGAAGTVQEVFQDACENYYADESAVAPMVLVGRRYWTEELPVWPLLRALATGRTMASRVHLVDTVEEAAALVGASPALSRFRG